MPVANSTKNFERLVIQLRRAVDLPGEGEWRCQSCEREPFADLVVYLAVKLERASNLFRAFPRIAYASRYITVEKMSFRFTLRIVVKDF